MLLTHLRMNLGVGERMGMVYTLNGGGGSDNQQGGVVITIRMLH